MEKKSEKNKKGAGADQKLSRENPAPNDSINTHHNSKKVALGPNTER